MINLIVLGLSLMATQVYSYEFRPLSGNYQIDLDKTRVLTAYEVEGVRTLNPAGVQRYQELRSSGSQCRSVGSSHFRCQTRLKDLSLPIRLTERLMTRFQAAEMSFGVVEALELNFKGEEIEEYIATQNMTMRLPDQTKSYEYLRYFFAPELEKIQTGKEGAGEFSFVRKGDVMELTFNQSLTLGREHFQVWLVALPFERD